MKINWSKYVDHIYCIQYILNKDRIEDLNNELYRVDILQSGIYDVIEQFPSPLYNILFKSFQNKSQDIIQINDKLTANLGDYADGRLIEYFNSLLGHYSAIKKAYLNNLDYVLVLEDDCRFLKDKQKIIDILDQTIPIFKQFTTPAIYGGSISYNDGQTTNGDDCNQEYENSYHIFINNEAYLAGTAFNIYNRQAMKIFIDFIESLNYAIVDQYHIIYKDTPMTYLILTKHLCIQQDWLYLMYNAYQDYNIFKPSIKELEEKRNWGNIFNRDIDKIYNDIKKYFHM